MFEIGKAKFGALVRMNIPGVYFNRGILPKSETKTGQIKESLLIELKRSNRRDFPLARNYGVITVIVSNQYHLLALIQKVIVLQRLFDFRVSWGKPFFAQFVG